MAVNMDEQLSSQLAVISQQGVMDNQQVSKNTMLAYQKDLFQGGQGETGVVFGALNGADRVPVVKGA